MKLSKTKQQFEESSGWSSNLFYDHYSKLKPLLEENHIAISFGRTVMYFSSTETQKKIKLYVHHNGRTKEYLTICDENGNELKTFHYTDETNDILVFVLEQLNEKRKHSTIS